MNQGAVDDLAAEQDALLLRTRRQAPGQMLAPDPYPRCMLPNLNFLIGD